MAINIIHLNKDNSELLSDVAEDVFDEKIDPERLVKYLAEPSHIMVVAISENTVIGQVLSVIHNHPDKPTELYIDDLGVCPSFHRQGIATKLIKQLFFLGNQRGCKEVWVATETDNEQAKGFYSALGLKVRSALVFETEI